MKWKVETASQTIDVGSVFRVTENVQSDEQKIVLPERGDEFSVELANGTFYRTLVTASSPTVLVIEGMNGGWQLERWVQRDGPLSSPITGMQSSFWKATKGVHDTLGEDLKKRLFGGNGPMISSPPDGTPKR